MREIRERIFRDKNGNIIEEGDVLFIENERREYQISLVHWDWRRNELGVIPFVPINTERIRFYHPTYVNLTTSEWLAAFASDEEYEKYNAEILVKFNSKSNLTNRDSDPKIIYSGGMPIPKMTRKQAEQIGDYYNYYKDCTLDNLNPKVYSKKLRALIKKLECIPKY